MLQILSNGCIRSLFRPIFWISSMPIYTIITFSSFIIIIIIIIITRNRYYILIGPYGLQSTGYDHICRLSLFHYDVLYFLHTLGIDDLWYLSVNDLSTAYIHLFSIFFSFLSSLHVSSKNISTLLLHWPYWALSFHFHFDILTRPYDMSG